MLLLLTFVLIYRNVRLQKSTHKQNFFFSLLHIGVQSLVTYFLLIQDSTVVTIYIFRSA